MRRILGFFVMVAIVVTFGVLGFNTTNSATNARQEPDTQKMSEKDTTQWSNPPAKMAMPVGTNTQDKRWQMASTIKRPLLLGNSEQFSLGTYPVLAEVNAALLQELRMEPLVGRVNVILVNATTAKPAVRKIGDVHAIYANAAPRGE